MPRSPWRDAIDGKASLLRHLRGEGTELSLLTYFIQANSLENVPRAERRRRAEAMMRSMRAQLEAQLIDAEPFALTHDIQEAITRQVNLAGGDRPAPLLERALARTYVLTDPPVPSGLVWLDHPMAICVPRSVAETNPLISLQGDVTNPEAIEVVASVVRAIMFS